MMTLAMQIDEQGNIFAEGKKIGIVSECTMNFIGKWNSSYEVATPFDVEHIKRLSDQAVLSLNCLISDFPSIKQKIKEKDIQVERAISFQL